MDGGLLQLVERDHELRVLAATAASVAAGESRIVLVTGEAGIGKSRLASSFLHTLPEGWDIVRLGGHRAERDPGAPFEGLVGEVAADGEAPDMLGRALAAACQARAEDQPLVVLVEDLQLLDPVAIGALPTAIDALAGHPVLVLATYRLGSHPMGSFHAVAVAELLRHPRSFELRLAPLTQAGVAAVLAQLEPRTAAGAVADLYARSGGNPFFVEQLAAVGPDHVPATVAEVVMLRVDALGPGARRLAAVLAVAGAPLPEVVAARVDGSYDEDLRDLRDAALVVLVDEGAALRHALVAETIVDGLAVDERLALHAALADALEHSLGSSPESIATHWLAAGDEERAVPWATVAADRLAGRRAHQTATELYRAASSHPPSDPGAHAALLERAAITASAAGAMDSVDWRLAAEDAATRRGERSRANRLWMNPLLLNATERYDAESSPPARLVLDAQQAVVDGRIDEARALAALAHDRAVQEGDASLRSMAALAIFYAGDIEGGFAWAEEAADHAAVVGDLAGEVLSRARLGRMAFGAGEMQAAVDHGARNLEISREIPAPDAWGHVAVGQAVLLAARGDLAALDELVDEVARLDLPVVSLMLHVPRGLGLLERGDVAEGRRLLEEIVAPAASAAWRWPS